MALREQDLERAFGRVFGPVLRRELATVSWSIAELRLTESDVNWLGDWFRDLGEEVNDWVDHNRSPIRRESLYGAILNLRQMFGALLLALASELWRRKGRDDTAGDALWPLVVKALPRDASWVRRVFPNSQPSVDCKTCFRDAALHLEGLRHAFDEGDGLVQAYFDTVKLQAGFCRNNTRFGITRWLAGYPKPLAVEALLGRKKQEWTAQSFVEMWTSRPLKNPISGLYCPRR